MGDVATIVTFNQIRPARSHAGSLLLDLRLGACITNPLSQQRIERGVPYPQPASMRIRPTFGLRAVRALVYGAGGSLRPGGRSEVGGGQWSEVRNQSHRTAESQNLRAAWRPGHSSGPAWVGALRKIGLEGQPIPEGCRQPSHIGRGQTAKRTRTTSPLEQVGIDVVLRVIPHLPDGVITHPSSELLLLAVREHRDEEPCPFGQRNRFQQFDLAAPNDGSHGLQHPAPPAAKSPSPLRGTRIIPQYPYWGTSLMEDPAIKGDPLPRSSLSTEFVLPGHARARRLGRLTRYAGLPSSTRNPLDRARGMADGPAGPPDMEA